MARTILIISLIIVTTPEFTPGSNLQEQSDELAAAVQELNRRYLTEDFPGKADAVEEFLRKYPETRYTMPVLEAGYTLIEHELDDPKRMLALTEYVIERVRQEDLKTEIMTMQLDLFIRLEMNERLLATAESLEEREVENFAVEEGLGHAYAAAGQWEKALDHYRGALEFATVDALKAEGRWDNYGESYRDLYLRGRKTAAHTGIAKCLVGQGKLEEALRHFETAAESANMNMFGAAEGDLNYLWGVALKQAGRSEEAKRILVAAALTRRDEASRAELLKSYVDRNGSKEGFDAYLFELRRELAPRMADFTLPDYEGALHTYDDLKGSAATMIVFWHPT